MRRALAVILAAAMISTIGAGTASAGTRQHAEYFYGSWKSHHRVDADTVDRELWYLDAYRSGDRTFGFVYHVVYRCTTTDGKTSCRRHGSEYGRARGLTTDEFTVDNKLASMQLATTVRFRSKDEPVKIAAVSLDLTGTGLVTRTKESYSYRQGCELYKFNGHNRYRHADGVPSITVDGVAQTIGSERRATIGVGDSVSISKEC